MLIKRGTARRLCIRLSIEQFPLCYVTVPDGRTILLAAVGSHSRACYVDKTGRSIEGPAVTIGAGGIDGRRPGTQRIG